PKCFTNQACEAFVGASQTRSWKSIECAISSTRPVRISPEGRKMPAVALSRASVITFQAPAASSSWIQSTHSYGAKTTSESFEPTSESTVKSRAKSAISSSFRSRGMSTVPSEISTWVRPWAVSQRLYSSSWSRAYTTSKKVPPITTRFSRRTSSLRSSPSVTQAVPQPSLTMSTYAPAVSSTSAQARGPSPLSRTCVSPPSRLIPRSRPWSEPGIELLQLLVRRRLHVVVQGVAVRVDPDRQRPEVLDPELPEALRHQLLPGDLLDLLDLGRLQGGGPADDREVDHPM